MGGKGAAASGCSYPSSGIFPEGNRNHVFKQPVPSIVGSIRSLFSVQAALFLEVSLHPDGFARAVRNPIPGHGTPVRDRASHETTREHHGAFGNVILMVVYAHPGERWVTYTLMDRFPASFQVIPALHKGSGASDSAGHASRMLSSNLCGRRRSAGDREDGGVFLCPFPRGIVSPHNSAARLHVKRQTRCAQTYVPPWGRAPAAPRAPSLPHHRGEKGTRRPSGMGPLSSPCRAIPASSPASGGGQASGERQGHGGAAAGGEGGPGPVGREGPRAPAVPP